MAAPVRVRSLVEFLGQDGHVMTTSRNAAGVHRVACTCGAWSDALGLGLALASIVHEEPGRMSA